MRLIDVDDAINKIDGLCVESNENWIGTDNQSFVDHSEVIDILCDAPTVDAVPIDSDLEQVLICAERYACGRQTYMPHTVIRYITPLIPYLDANTLHVLDRDMQEAVRIGGLGDPQIDAPEWMAFHECVKNERKRRVENNV